MSEPKLYRVKGWDELFESAKSRTYGTKSQAYMPNKFGEGYWRIMSACRSETYAPELQGPAIYGAWCALICLLSRKQCPRQGYLTDTGRHAGDPMDATGIALQTGIHEGLVTKMLDICSSKSVGWLEVVKAKDTTVSVARIADGPPPLPLPIQTNPNQSNKNCSDLDDSKSKRTMILPANFSGNSATWDGITEADRKTWVEACPAVNIDNELARAWLWCRDNGAKGKKRDYRRFLSAWLMRCQERGGSKVSQRGPDTSHYREFTEDMVGGAK